jgi:hypothetical protein
MSLVSTAVCESKVSYLAATQYYTLRSLLQVARAMFWQSNSRFLVLVKRYLIPFLKYQRGMNSAFKNINLLLLSLLSGLQSKHSTQAHDPVLT